jgi:hypothetical protein
MNWITGCGAWIFFFNSRYRKARPGSHRKYLYRAQKTAYYPVNTANSTSGYREWDNTLPLLHDAGIRTNRIKLLISGNIWRWRFKNYRWLFDPHSAGIVAGIASVADISHTISRYFTPSKGRVHQRVFQDRRKVTLTTATKMRGGNGNNIQYDLYA